MDDTQTESVEQTKLTSVPTEVVERTLEDFKTEEVTMFTVWDLQSLAYIVAAPTRQGSGIKDLRLMMSLKQKLEAAIPAKPERPAPYQFADVTKPTKEEKEAEAKMISDYNKALEDWVNKEMGMKLSWPEKSLLRQKVSSFTQYQEDPVAAKRSLALADKLVVN